MIKKLGIAATIFWALDALCLIGIFWLNSSGIWGVELMVKAGSLALLMIPLTIGGFIAMAIKKRK